jgi:hypothetical protein
MGQDDGEFVTAHAICPIGAPQRGRQQLAEAAQDAVATRMALAVIDRLELVEIDEHQRQRRPVAHGGLDLTVELLVEGAMVAQPGERITQRVGQCGLVTDLELRLTGDDRGDGARHHGGADHQGRAAPEYHGERLTGVGHGGRHLVGTGEAQHGEDGAHQHPARQRTGAQAADRGGRNVLLQRENSPWRPRGSVQ